MTTRVPMRVLDALMASRWAMDEDYLRTMLAVVHRESDLQAIERELGRPLEHTYAVTVRDGVASLPVTGPMFRYANLFTAISGATSYEVLATDLGAAMSDPAVRAVVLNIDSPGGDVNGCAELAQLIASFRGQKPIIAYVSHLGASAAYWLATAADRIVANETAIVGSIGVRFAVVDTSARDQANGVRRFEIISSQTPKKNDMDPATESGRASAQRLADSLAEVFIARVAEYRGVSEAMVRDNYGQGGVFVGRAALAAGLVDEIGTYEGVLAALADGGGRSPGRRFTAHMERRMPDTTQTPAPKAQFETGARVKAAVAKTVTVEAGAVGEVLEVSAGPAYAVRFPGGDFRWMAEAELEAATDNAEDPTPADTPADPPAQPEAAAATPAPAPEAPAEPTVKSSAELVAEARAAERDRILGIEKLARPGMEKLVAQAKADPDCTPEAFARMALEADAQRGRTHLASLKADEDQLQAPRAQAVVPGADSGPQADASRILTTYRRHHPSRADAQRN